ncbi:MAG: type II toxin-antitoxin system RelE/ParE family toxin [Flavobacteriales bacterium]|nr:type II toxin-antitoxin system RelE/ParE family toxin [Flavobacteriales bacterium]
MVKRKVIWTEKANLERKDILEYWIKRNKSKNYSLKLNKLFVDTTQVISEMPTIGRKTDIDNVYVKIISNYLIFYEFNKIQLKVLSIWDGRRDKNSLKIEQIK